MSLIDPAVPLLEPYLEYRRKQSTEGGLLGYREHEEAIAVWNVDIKDRLKIQTGLVPRVHQILAEHGHEVIVTDHREYGERFTIDKDYLRRLKGEDRRLARAVRREPMGQIEVKSFADMILAMRLIIDLYPKAKILIPVATKEMARKVRVKLDTAATDFPVRIIGSAWPKRPWRCTTCTFQSIATCPTDDYDILLLPESLRSTSDTAIKAMARFNGPCDRKVWRAYTFVQPGTRFSGRERIRLEGIAGEMIYRLAPEHAGVRVLWLPTPGCAAIPKDATALAFKRSAIWQNDRRNDYIAGVARAFARLDRAKLRTYGVPFEGGEPALRYLPQTRVELLVASPEQAEQMKKRLPGWEVLAATPGTAKSGDGPGGEEQTGTIITEARAAKAGLDADVLIRAGGSSGKMCLKGLPRRLEGDERRDVIVADFKDEFDQRAEADAKRRAREYELLGWQAESRPGNP